MTTWLKFEVCHQKFIILSTLDKTFGFCFIVSTEPTMENGVNGGTSPVRVVNSHIISHLSIQH